MRTHGAVWTAHQASNLSVGGSNPYVSVWTSSAQTAEQQAQEHGICSRWLHHYPSKSSCQRLYRLGSNPGWSFRSMRSKHKPMSEYRQMKMMIIVGLLILALMLSTVFVSLNAA